MIGALIGVAFLGAIYPIVLYPLFVMLVARVRPRPWSTAPVQSALAHIVTVHNEERRIRAKLENCLRLQCPPGCSLETIVVSDGSSDATEAIVREYRERGVRYLALPRRGKEWAQIDAVQTCDAQLLVFSDAAALIEPAALAPLLAPFADRHVHAVSGTDVPDAPAAATGEGLYVRFEMAVRRAESLAGSLVGLSGCFFAVRREIALAWIPEVPSDMSSALLAIRRGGRAVAADQARCTYAAAPSLGAEFSRKRRTVHRGLRCLWEYRDVLAPSRPLISWEVASHKLLRFSIPIWMLLALAAVLIALARYAQPGLLAWAVLGGALAIALGTQLRRARPVRALVFGVVSVAAVLLAWKDFLTGKREVRWIPTARP